jgi:ADP-ribose pyrophosphatase
MSHDHEIAAGNYLRLMRKGRYEYVERVRGRAVVAILAVTEQGRLLIVEQHRPPLDAMVLALPAGLVGDDPGNEGEHLEEAARRELLEETGYSAGTMTHVCTGASAPGASSIIVHLFRATDLVRQGAGGGVDDEAITVHEVPVREVPAWLKEQEARGAVVDFKLFAALFFVSPS